MSLICRIKGHKFNSAGVCYRCGERCFHDRREKIGPCTEKCTDCGRTFTEHLWMDTDEPGEKVCSRCGQRLSDPLAKANRMAKEQGKIYISGNMTPDQKGYLLEALKYASEKGTDIAAKIMYKGLIEPVRDGYIEETELDKLISSAELSIELYRSIPLQLGKYISLKEALLKIKDMYDGIKV